MAAANNWGRTDLPDDGEPYPLTNSHPDQYRHGFHGSRHDLQGDEVLSAAMRREKGIDVPMEWPHDSSDQFVNYWHGMPKWDRDGESDAPERAELEAWDWASRRDEDVLSRAGRPRVYEGEAKGIVGADANLMRQYLFESDPDDPYLRGTHDAPLNWELTEELQDSTEGAMPMGAESFKVADTHWIPPGKAGKAVQGTLPHVNWNQFGAPNVGNPEDVAVGLSTYDHGVALERSVDARKARDRAKQVDHGPALPNASRDAERRSVEAGQMRLPGF